MTKSNSDPITGFKGEPITPIEILTVNAQAVAHKDFHELLEGELARSCRAGIFKDKDVGRTRIDST